MNPILARTFRAALLALCALAASALPAHATVPVGGPDSDHDGVPDSADAFPCDPSASAVVYAPARDLSGLVLFEDLWPQNGDFDFNDQSVSYNYVMMINAAGNVTAIQASFNVLSAGASIHNGVYLHLPGIPRAAAATIVRNSDDGVLHQLTPVAGEDELVIPIADDTRALFDRQDSFINTDLVHTSQQGHAINLMIRFTAPVRLDAGAAPFDLFIARTGDYGHQIHLPFFAGTKLMQGGLFGTADDGSTPDRHFVNKGGVPFALVVPAETPWPQETVAIDRVYPDILTFGTSGGLRAKDWYLTNVNSRLQWTHGVAALGSTSPSARPVPIQVGPGFPTADTSCIPSWGGTQQFEISASTLVAEPWALAVAPSGAIGMAGDMFDLTRFAFAPFAIAFDPLGHQFWSAAINYPSVSSAEMLDAAFDPQGNLYAVGWYFRDGFPFGYQGLLVKYIPPESCCCNRRLMPREA